ncbi:hypothetical protein [Goodfellowiella coeruleoviolacea]|uniref:Mycothiol maleylpyruvate isomerase N-terminal domain-containing protein n=1 Tax=Goodfellowiella coeruleoviolacea TaxID=334858 RepID=A0AAE3KGF5_9PSEU|nr:hypothetical protein [Goodfellowiella coeruleoviolacea]MCP2166130.1 Mycothiol maleylpyruvate isomerase N-terminal domain-containing protein [Goodfellowiella coeruleoviolacea]
MAGHVGPVGWDSQRWIEVFTRQAALFREAVDQADLETGVPSCPGWTFAELVVDVAAFLELAGDYLRTGSLLQLPPPARVAGADPVAYLDAQLAATGAALAATPADSPVWTPSPASPDQAWVWHRRLAHRMNLRRWDAQAALRTLVPTDTDQAVDGIDEVLGTLLAIKYATDVAPEAGGTAVVRCTDAPAAWHVRFVPGVAAEVRAAEPGEPADAEVTGPATSVYYGLWRRDELPATGQDKVRWALRLDGRAA